MAQSQSVQVRGTTFGVRAGLNLQNINGRDAGDDKLENKLVPRFHVGVNAEIQLHRNFMFNPVSCFQPKEQNLKMVQEIPL